MAYKVRYNKEVLADLEEVTRYAADHFPDQFDVFFSGLLAKIDQLATYPRMGPVHIKHK